MKILIELFTYLLILACIEKTFAEDIKLPPPDFAHSVSNRSSTIGWKNNSKPIAPNHFTVTKFADDFRNARWAYVAPNGDILIAESQGDRITLLRDSNNTGVADTRTIFLSGLHQPFGMLILNNYFYVANTDAVFRYPYKDGMMKIEGKGEKIKDLPGSRRHWTRNIIANKKGDKIYIAIGSASNVGEDGMQAEINRANILEMNPDGSNTIVYASGLRNPVGMDWQPDTNQLWTTVNERDEMGDDLVPDYLTVVKQNDFYGWPYAYWGTHPDPRLKGARPDLVKTSLTPTYSLGAHTASLGLVFYKKNAFPQKYHDGAFIAQHGSWNRSSLVGYKVIFVPFKDGMPSGPAEDFLTGFIANAAKSEVYGRPVGVAVLSNGSLLVVDDSSNTLWNITYK